MIMNVQVPGRNTCSRTRLGEAAEIFSDSRSEINSRSMVLSAIAL